MSQTLNGTANAQTTDTTALKNTKPKTTRKLKTPELFIDGGSSHTKSYLEKIAGSYQSICREFPKGHDIPTGYLGVFQIGEKGYAVGESALSLSGGKLHEGYSDDNKIKLLAIWIIGALTTHPNFLFKKAKKVKLGVVEIDLKLSLLSLSSHRKKEIEKAINNIQFTFDDREFKINITEYKLYPEGYGAACAAKRWLKSNDHKDAKFHVLDLGGGTFTHTPYSNLNGVPRASNQKSVSGAGVMAITEFFANEAPKGDTGGNIYHFSRLKEALETSTINEDGTYSSVVIFGDGETDIGDRLHSGLEAWAREIVGVRELLRDIRQVLRKNERVFLTGGGFSVPTIQTFIANYLGNSENVILLDTPESINITGIK